MVDLVLYNSLYYHRGRIACVRVRGCVGVGGWVNGCGCVIDNGYYVFIWYSYIYDFVLHKY